MHLAHRTIRLGDAGHRKFLDNVPIDQTPSVAVTILPLGSVQILSHIFSGNCGSGFDHLLIERVHVHVAFC